VQTCPPDTETASVRKRARRSMVEVLEMCKLLGICQ
jgi:hypothetical protein